MNGAEAHRASVRARAEELDRNFNPEKKNRMSILAHASPSNSQSPPLELSHQDRITHTPQLLVQSKPLPIEPKKQSKIPISSFSNSPSKSTFTPLSPMPEGEEFATSGVMHPQRQGNTPNSSPTNDLTRANDGVLKTQETEKVSTAQVDPKPEKKPGPPVKATSKITRKPPPAPLKTSNLGTKSMSAPLIPVLSFRGSNLFDEEGSRSWLTSPVTGSTNSNFLSTPPSTIPSSFGSDLGSSFVGQKPNMIIPRAKDTEPGPENNSSREDHVTDVQAANPAGDQTSPQQSPLFDYDAFPKTPTTPGFRMTLPQIFANTRSQNPEKHSLGENSLDSNRVSLLYSFQQGDKQGDVSPVSPLSPRATDGERPWKAPWNPTGSTSDGALGTSENALASSSNSLKIVEGPLNKGPSPKKHFRDVSMLKLNAPSEEASVSMLSPTRSHFSTDSSRSSSSDGNSRASSRPTRTSYGDTIDIDYHSFLINTYNTSQMPPTPEPERSVNFPNLPEVQPLKRRVSRSTFWNFKNTASVPLATRVRDSFLSASPTTRILSFNDRPTVRGARLKQKMSLPRLGSNAKAEQILGTQIPRITSPEPRGLPMTNIIQPDRPNHKSASNGLGERADTSIDSSRRYESTSTAVTDEWSKGYQNGRSTGNTTPTEYPPTKSKGSEPTERKTARSPPFRIPLPVSAARRQKSLPSLPDHITDYTVPAEYPPELPNSRKPDTSQFVNTSLPPPKAQTTETSQVDHRHKSRPLSSQPVIAANATEDEKQGRQDQRGPPSSSLETSSQSTETEVQGPGHIYGKPTDPIDSMDSSLKTRTNPRKPAALLLNPKLRPLLLPALSASRVSVRSAPIADDKGKRSERFSELRMKANEFSIDTVDPISKVLVMCCSCRHFQDLLERDYALMMRAEKTPYGKVATDPRIECRCGHPMTTVCCEGYAAVVYLRKRLH